MTQKHLILTIGPEKSGKTTWVRNYLLGKYPDSLHLQPSVDGPKKHLELFQEALKDGRNIVIDSTNETEKIRRRYVDESKKYGYTKIYYVFQHFIKNDPKFLGIYEAPTKGEYNELSGVPKLSRVLDLRPIIKNSRYIVVGDLHGCFDEFRELLTSLKFDQDSDFVISAGDLTDRGPKSVQVLNYFMSVKNAYYVEGNHDNKLKRWMNGNKVKVAHGLGSTIQQIDVLPTVDKETLLLKCLDSLRKAPQIIRLPDLDGKPQYVVHAAIDTRFSVYTQKYDVSLYSRDIEVNGVKDIWYNFLSDDVRVCCGHIIHDEPRPNPNVVCLDGGVASGGCLRGIINGKDIVELKCKQQYWREDNEREDGEA